MLEAFEYKGRWWLPENPRNKISGILTYTPGKNISLELIGSFVKSPPFIRHMLQPEIILGTSDNGKRITLYKTFETYYAGAAKSGFVAKTVFAGKHYIRPSDIQFSSLSVNFTFLEEWLSLKLFEVKYEGTDITAKYMPPEIFKVDISPLNSTLSFDYYFEGGEMK